MSWNDSAPLPIEMNTWLSSSNMSVRFKTCIQTWPELAPLCNRFATENGIANPTMNMNAG